MINNYEIHPYANLVPMAVPLEQAALEKDIKDNGQLEPITLFREKVVDGRCRQKACNSLGIPVKVERLGHNTTKKELISFVLSKNIRRNLTSTQKSIIAMRQWQEMEGKGTQADVASLWGVGVKQVKSAIYLQKVRPDFVDILFEGKGIGVGIGKTSTSIQLVAKYVKEEIEKMREGEVIGCNGWNPESSIITERGKNRFRKSVGAICGFGEEGEGRFDREELYKELVWLINIVYKEGEG